MKTAIFFIFLFLITPIVIAADPNDNSPFDFGQLIHDLVSAIFNSLKSFILDILNAPISPLVNFLKRLIQEPVNIDLFQRYWEIIVYVISIFYSLILLTAGFNFITSSYDVIRRERAKEWLKNSILIIIFVSSSYLIYKLMIDISSIINTGLLSLVNNNLFLITMDNPVNFGLELLLLFVYIFTLIITIVLLGIRYLLASLGLVLFPIGIALNYVPPLKSYGKLILNSIITIVFLPIIVSLILLISSKLLEVGIFSSFKIIVAIVAFMLINSVLVITALFIGVKSVTSVISGDLVRAIKLTSGM